MANTSKSVKIIDVHQLAAAVRNRIENVLIIDSRSFLEFNTCHVCNTINVCCSKIVKRRLQQDKISVKELLIHCCQFEVNENYDVVVYDQGSLDLESIPTDSFLSVLLKKLILVFRSVNLVQGGFLEFQATYPNLCEDKTTKCAPLMSLSQPCLPIANQGPTRILPFLYLGSQHEALNKETLMNHNISYELNVSTTCPKPDFIQDSHFMRISVNDNYSEKLLPYFSRAFRFLDKVRESSGCVLVHCLAGISRSPTIAIAYVMRHLRMGSDDAYRYVKSKRPTISPNFNFLGQLLEYEKQLCRENILDYKPEILTAPPLCGGQKRLCRTDMRSAKLSLKIPASTNVFKNKSETSQLHTGDQSPTTALAKLSFDVSDNDNQKENKQVPSASRKINEFQKFRSMSCSGDWISDKCDSTVEYKDRKTLDPESNNIQTMPLLPDSVRHKKGSAHKYYKKDDDKTHLAGVDWIEQGIPVSSLKELNFTPCQTSRNNSAENSHENTPERDCEDNTVIYSHSTYDTETLLEKKYKKYKFLSSVEGIIKDYKKEFDDITSHSTSSSTWYVLNAPYSESSTAVNSFKFPVNKDYKRSDSVSTSGVGSEASDYLDTSTESHSSSIGDELDNYYEEDYDEDLKIENVVLRKSRDMLKLAEKRSQDSAYYSLTTENDFDNSHDCKSQFCLSRNLENYSTERNIDDIQGRDNTSEHKQNSSCEKYACELGSSRDSGILGSPGWIWHDKLSYDLVKLNDENDSIQKHQSTETKISELEDCSKMELEREYPYTTFEHKTLSKYCKLDTSLVHNDQLNIKETLKGDGLYRAHSCPGILGWLQKNLDDSSQGIVDKEFPRLRKTKATVKKTEKFRNRYSCGSLDYFDYQQISTDYSYESCPDVLHCGGYKQGNDSASSEQIMSPSHRMFRRNINMIQVS